MNNFQVEFFGKAAHALSIPGTAEVHWMQWN